MNETDSQTPQNMEDRNSWSPEVFLAVLLHELRNPLAVIKGWALFLSDENTKEYFPQGIEIISERVAVIEKLCEGVEEYIREHHENSNP